MTTVRSALSDGRKHRIRAAEPTIVRRRHASRRRHVRRQLREKVLSVFVLVVVLGVTLVLLGLQWLQSSPTSETPATTTPTALTIPGGSP